MKPKTALLLASILTTVFGLLLLFPTAFTLSTFGIEAHADGLMLGKDVGLGMLAMTVLNVMGRDAQGSALRAILYTNIFLHAGEVVLNAVEVALGVAPAAVLPGEALRVVLVVCFGLALRQVKDEGAQAFASGSQP